MHDLDGFGHPAMDCHPPSGRQSVVQGVAYEGVGETVPKRWAGRFNDEMCLAGLLESSDETLFLKGLRRLNDGQLKFQADHGGDSESLVGLLRQVREAPAYYFSDAFGDAHLFDAESAGPVALRPLQRSRLGQMTENLPDEEWVALRFLVEGSGQNHVLVVQRMTRRLLHERGYSGGVESSERQALHYPVPTQVG